MASIRFDFPAAREGGRTCLALLAGGIEVGGGADHDVHASLLELVPGGPLFGVQFSQLVCSDLVSIVNNAGAATKAAGGGNIAPRASPLGLSADPGGIPRALKKLETGLRRDSWGFIKAGGRTEAAPRWHPCSRTA